MSFTHYHCILLSLPCTIHLTTLHPCMLFDSKLHLICLVHIVSQMPWRLRKIYLCVSILILGIGLDHSRGIECSLGLLPLDYGGTYACCISDPYLVAHIFLAMSDPYLFSRYMCS